jgi:hypothetical protein
MATLYRKTAKGQTEIETRAHRLLPRLRTALILVDGRRDDSELRKLIPGDPDETVKSLLEGGFIEAAGTMPEKPVRLAPAPNAAASPAGPSSQPGALAIDPKAFEQHRRGAVRMLNDKAGPMAESVAVKIEKCRNWNELLPALQLAQRAIANAAGSAAAAEFASKFIETPPG